jgi:hypothetical protein
LGSGGVGRVAMLNGEKTARACKAAAIADEASELIEEGLVYVFDVENMKLFRKSR